MYLYGDTAYMWMDISKNLCFNLYMQDWNGVARVFPVVTELGRNARYGTVYERIPDHNCNSRGGGHNAHAENEKKARLLY